MAKTRQFDNIFILGIRDTEPLSRFNKLPTTREVLLRFHHHLYENKSVCEASYLTIEELLTVWGKASIPTKQKNHAVEKLQKTHTEWLLLKKNKNRSSNAQREREQKFVEKLDVLFEISHANAMTMIKNEEDRNFLMDQRAERKMAITTLDVKLAKKQERTLIRQHKEQERRERNIASTSKTTVKSSSQVPSNGSSDSDCDDKDMEEYVPRFTTKRLKHDIQQLKCKKNTLFSHHVTSALDRNQISDREAVRLMIPISAAFCEDPSSLPISRSTVQRIRKKSRREFADMVKETFDPKYPIVVHWDGKILPDIMNCEKVDRLPVIVSGNGEEKLLGVPKLAATTGENISQTIYDLLTEWNIVDKVQAISFDTTSVNTGNKKGACTLLELKIGKELMWLACRHHILEIILAKAFNICFGSTSSPEIPLFKRFRAIWNAIQRDKFQILQIPPEIDFLKTETLDILCKINVWPRDDYKELIELTMIILGMIPKTIHWRAPGALHHARWMGKLIYAIKIYLFRSQTDVFKLSKREEIQLERFVKFCSLLYTKAWIQAPLAAEAPTNDLQFWTNLKKYESTDFEISQAAKEILERHLWYLSDELVGLSLFSDTVTSNEKCNMVNNMKNKSEELRKVRGNSDIFKKKEEHSLSDFVNENTIKLFKRLNIGETFLHIPPEEWEQNDDYVQGRECVKNLRVVNDTAERGVQLFQNFNKVLTNKEEEKQFLLQVVEANRNAISSKSLKKDVLRSIVDI